MVVHLREVNNQIISDEYASDVIAAFLEGENIICHMIAQPESFGNITGYSVVEGFSYNYGYSTIHLRVRSDNKLMVESTS